MGSELERLKTGRRSYDKDDAINWKQVSVGMIALLFLYLGLKSAFEDTNKKIEGISKQIDFVLYQNQSYEKNMKVLQGSQCASCHITPSMVLPKSTLSMEQFISYVRGENRFNQNTQMPKFDASMISDAELEKIWKGLY